MTNTWRGSLIVASIGLIGSAGFAAAAVVGVGTADETGVAAVCVEGDPSLTPDQLKDVLERNLVISQGEIQPISIEGNQAKILVNTTPGTPVDATVPDEIASAHGLSDCTGAPPAAAGVALIAVGPPGGAFASPGVGIAALTALGVGGIFGGLCAAGELGCGDDDGDGDGGGGIVIPPQPPPPPPVLPTPRPPKRRPVSPSN